MIISCSYNPHKNNISKHTEILRKNLDLYSSQYESIIIIGDLNNFCNAYDLRSLIKEPTRFKNPKNPSCIDLILTNSPRSFQGSCVVETGLSDVHRMVATIMKPEISEIASQNKNLQELQ